jgi:3-oxoacyl-[acyl-carrier protein] reductase
LKAKPAFDFTGGVALVTGASRGIGAVTARMLGAGGAKVLDAAFYVTREVVKPMARRQKGSIVIVSSIAGSIGSFGQSAYAAAKAGLVGFAKSVALEYGPKGVRTNVVIPGIINTDMTKNLREDFRKSVLVQIPCNRFGEPEEVAGPICFLLSDAASYINGATLHINGGGSRL